MGGPAKAAPPAGRPLRVLHVTFSLDAGGMENGVVNTSRALEGAGFEMHACCLARGGRFVERFPKPERVHILGKQEGFSASLLAALRRHVARVKPDVIHTHNFGPLLYTVPALWGMGGRILHGEHAELTPAELAPRRRLLRRWLYRHARKVHTVSEALRGSLVRQGFPSEKLVALPNGVDTSYFSPGDAAAARAELGLPAHATVLGLVGRYGEYKRHGALVEAFTRLAGRDETLHLLLVGGGGPLEARVRAQVEASPCAARITIAGFQKDPRPFYRAMDLLVVPSLNEGLSNALLEAMACGTPVLAHTACGNEEVIAAPHTGFLTDMGTAVKLEAALAEALRQRDGFEAQGAAARALVRERFSFGTMARGYARLYREVAD